MKNVTYFRIFIFFLKSLFLSTPFNRILLLSNNLWVCAVNGRLLTRYRSDKTRSGVCAGVLEEVSGSCTVMDHLEEDSALVQPKEEEVEAEKQHPSDQSVLPTEGQDGTEDQERCTQGREQDSGEEWETDLETEDATDKRQNLSCAEVYLRACRRIGTTPISSFLRHLGEANLNLNHYGVGPLGAKALAIALQNNNCITNLELEDCLLKVEGTRYLMEMLQTNISIQSLNLSTNQLYLEGAEIISKMLSDNYYIKSIKLAGNHFDDSAAKYFADALKVDYVIKELDLSHNKFCDTGGEHLGQMLATNVGIEVLNLSWNYIRMKGAVVLATGLKVNSTLKELHLAGNGFCHIGAEPLGQALKQNSTLELLDLSCNRIYDEDVSLLCQGLATNHTLRVLKLSQNPMTEVGALTLIETVKNNPKSAVEKIDISTVFVCEAFVELLEEARRRRPALDVCYSVMTSVTRNLAALQIFQKFFKEQNESIMGFFQALDKEGTMKVSTAAFRKAVKAANIPLDQRQLNWLVKKFDKTCTATIIYSS